MEVEVEQDSDSDFEQKEEVTDMLHDLLEKSYVDGFSVPKELLQNADDAGATEVCFLLDERENRDARTNLITDNMESLQGPAFWAYNNAIFSDTDFENIKRIGASIKRNDASKVGRFGRGFNSVYNLTDVPSFISGSTMAILDPHIKYLKRRGKKIDFKLAKSRALLDSKPQQFKPFQEVFGCKLQNNGHNAIHYAGTLFRLPLRTVGQASESKIKAESYDESRRRDLLKMLLERAGNLLLFTQSVVTIKVFHLPRGSATPQAARPLLEISRTSNNRLVRSQVPPLADQTILQYFTTQWPSDNDIEIVQDVHIRMAVTAEAASVCGVDPHSSSTRWRLAWASGVDRSATLAQQHAQEGLVPMATVAALMGDSGLDTVENSPSGFYTSGHLFCFMPLPDKKQQKQNSLLPRGLPVHINGTFDLSSDRRSLKEQDQEELGREGGDWNSALLSDAVTRAYLLLLENVQTEAASDPDFKRFFDLWPVSGEAVLRGSVLKRLVAGGHKVFPVLGEGVRWVAFADAWFLDQQFRQQECGYVAWKATQHFWQRSGHLVDLPAELFSALAQSDQGKRFQERVISEIEFFEESLFPHIDSSYWQQQQQHRDKLVLHALLQDKRELNLLLKTRRCIPCTQLNTLKQPDELIDPGKEASNLFSPSDGRFPQGAMRDESQPAPVSFCSFMSLERLFKLGMIKDELPFGMVMERCEYVKTLVCEESTKLRAKQLITYLSSYTNASTRINRYRREEIDKLSNVQFLPVLSKPKDWLLPWAAETRPGTVQLAAPRELHSQDLKHLVGCHRLLLDNDALGISKGTVLRSQTIKRLGVQTEQDVASTELFKTAVEQLRTVAQTVNTGEGVTPESVLRICTPVYSYLSRCCQQKQHGRKHVLKNLGQEDVVWTSSGFVDSSKVAMNFDCRPYRFKLETTLHPYRHFFEDIGVKEHFDVGNLASLLEEVREEHDGNQLPGEAIGLVSHVAQQLAASRVSVDDLPPIFLPDCHGYMRPTHHLCLNDCEWLKETDTMKFISGTVPNYTASKLGVKSKRRQDFESLCKFLPFGQNEPLTNCIRRLLRGYEFDSSLFKELLQNADDAGATEIKFIKDWRQLGTERTIEGCEPLQGPALCVFNDQSFTSKDMEGIQNLGRGSKGQEVLKTGRYGVGFNAVYHVTDAPSFWTLLDGVHETICVLDPNCQYVPGSEPHRPGIQLTDINRIREDYPDMFDGYLGSVIDMTQPGTLFRLPLRTTQMAQMSEIKNSEVTEREIDSLLDTFQKEMSSCLLFLNNVQTIGIYSVTKEGSLVLKDEVTNKKDLSLSVLDNTEAFKQHLLRASASLGDKTLSMTDIEPYDSFSLKTIQRLNGPEEQWLIAQRVGFQNTNGISCKLQSEWHEDHFQLLPRGGVAVRLPQGPTAQPDYQAFCTLPLPVVTNLPVHVNGYFALEHETRRNLWHKTENGRSDTRTEWNELIAARVIVPAYTRALQRVKEHLFPSAEEIDSAHLHSKLRYYNSLFPDLAKAPSQFWKSMMKELYKQIAEEQLPIFPVISVRDGSLEWHPVINSEGFAGHFINLEAFFKQVQDEHDELIQVQRATELKSLLIDMNMKVLEVPYRIFEHFQESTVQKVTAVSPKSVAKFLKSAGSRTPGSCNVDNLPQPVGGTKIKTPANVAALLHFIQCEPALLDDLEGLPLCLRQSGDLHTFHAVDDRHKPIASEVTWVDLLSGSADMFMHERIQRFFLPTRHTALTWIKEFDIPTLVHLLPRTISADYFKAPFPCSFQSEGLTREWLNHLWQFVESKLYISSLSGSEVCEFVEEELQGLLEWSLIPVTVSMGQGYRAKKTQERLYPVKKMHEVVFLSRNPDPSNRDVWETLKALPLIFLNYTLLPSSKIVNSMVASINHPLALLEALSSCAGSLNPNSDQAQSILAFFNRNMSGLKDSLGHDKRKLQWMLRCLPVFPGFDGKPKALSSDRMVLCLGNSVHPGGLEEWAVNRQIQLVLLRKYSLPKALQEFLCFDAPGAAQFYFQYLLPTLQDLPWATIVDHMEVINQGLRSFSNWEANDKKRVIMELCRVKFIELNGKLFKANHFCSPHQPVFRMMCQPGHFPPSPYHEPHWEQFMKSAGMIPKVTSQMYLYFAKQLQDEGKSKVSELTAAKSDTLVQHLFSCHANDFDNDFYQQIKVIRFVRPSAWAHGEEGKILCRIAEPFSRDRLVSFAESCGEEHLSLVWTSCCILHPYANSKTKMDNVHTRKLGLTQKAPLDKVVQHVKSVCQSLGKHIDKKLLDPVKIVMRALYRYLQEHATDEDNAILKQLTFIFDAENQTMLKPENVVINLRKEDAIKGHIAKAPVCFGEFFEFFEILGTCQEVTANHYATVLSQLKQKAAEEALHVEELKITKIAVKELFRCLESSKPQIKQLTVDNVYLPSEYESLIKSSLLVFDDTNALGKRIPTETNDMVYFLGFKKLDIKNTSYKKELELLPREHQLQFLSQMIREVVPDEAKQRAEEGRHSLDVVDKLSSPDFVECVVRKAFNDILRANSSEFSEDTAVDICERLSTISCFEVTDLRTVILWKEQPIDGTDVPAHAFCDIVSGGDEPCTVYLDRVYCDSNNGVDSPDVIQICAAAVVNAIDFRGEQLFIELAIKSPGEAMKYMDREGLEMCDLNARPDNETVFPPAGTFIPLHFHCCLDNSFGSFDNGEHVGYEVYDPQVDEPSTDDNIPVYVYGIVVDESEQEGPVTRFTQRYRVRMGRDKGIIEASVTKLYKFIRKPRAATPTQGGEVVPFSEERAAHGTGEGAFTGASPTLTLNFKEVMKEIKEMLEEASKEDETILKRVKKRLYLKWHPDKNRDHQEFYTRVFQRIKYYEELLEQGKKIPDEDDDGRSSDHQPSSSRESSFFKNMFNRGRTYNEHFRNQSKRSSRSRSGFHGRRSHGRDYHWEHHHHADANPQPGEARRWFRQAQADLSSGQAARGTYEKGHNWVCFQCYQAVEKALKAVLYNKDANKTSLQEHSIVVLAAAVGDDDLADLASRLQREVGGSQRMCYPDAGLGSNIPAEAYSVANVDVALDVAEKTVDEVKTILGL